MKLKFKLADRQVRLIFGDGDSLSRMDHIRGNERKVFAVIGPFDGHMDKPELQAALKFLCRGHNIEPQS